MSILSDIVAAKQREIEERRSLYPIRLLERSLYFETPPVSLKKYLLRPDRQGVIAEIKRRSPSAGAIHEYVNVEQTSIGYMQAGASALSVLTDAPFFGGSSEDLRIARRFNFCPILRKDFILDEYQVIESKSIGADAILLIAAILDRTRLLQLLDLAKSLGMEAIVEIHTEQEADSLPDTAELIGVNRRDLCTFEVSNAPEQLPADKAGRVWIAESGIRAPEDVVQLRDAGFQAFLIGETFMRHARPERACRDFIAQLNRLERVYAED